MKTKTIHVSRKEQEMVYGILEKLKNIKTKAPDLGDEIDDVWTEVIKVLYTLTDLKVICPPGSCFKGNHIQIKWGA